MADLGAVAWPPEPIRTERLVLREPQAGDRAAFIELLASPEMGMYLGGTMIGQVILKRATGLCEGKAELGYLFLPQAWGFGYAGEACTAALGWLDGTLPGEPVVLKTQTANTRSMRLSVKLGLTEIERYIAWDAEQWLGMRLPVTLPRQT